MADKKREAGKEEVVGSNRKNKTRYLEERDFRIRLINIQGLSKEKYYEVEKLVEKDLDIVCITEGQNKIDKIQNSIGIKRIETLREQKDKKGGGLMILTREGKLELKKTQSRSNDILDVEGRVGNENIRLILLYMAAGGTAEAAARNRKIEEEVEQKIQSNEVNNLIVLGDLNGHLGILGEQIEDRNGRMIMKWMNEQNLVLLNIDEKCKGKYTWSARKSKSVIDYMLVNSVMYSLFERMEIDENKICIDISDHSLVQATFKYRNAKSEKENGNEQVSQLEFYSIKEELLEKFKKEMEEKMQGRQARRIENLNSSIKEVANVVLKRTRKKRTEKDKQRVDPIWITKKIVESIKERKALNRSKRNESDDIRRGQLEQMYRCKKIQVQEMIREEMSKHEIKKTEEIKKDKSRKLWENIDALRNKERKEENIQLYDTEGNKLEQVAAEKKLEEYWKGIYEKHENRIDIVWNTEEKEEYNRKLERERSIVIQDSIFAYILREHLDAVDEVEHQIRPMEKPDISVEKVERRVKKLKNKKAAGPDGLKAEIYKAMIGERNMLVKLTECFRNELEEEEKPEEWKRSKTKMLEKTRKPTPKDLRPIALTNISYKLYMSLLKDEIEDHLRKNNVILETQAGFTEGGRVEDNLFILQYCVEENFRKKKPLIVISIDYSKAYDSIKREKIIEVMKTYKINSKVINSIAEVYKGDKTMIEVGSIEKEMEVSSGIRQGCTGSTTIFKMITYKIIKELENKGKGFENEVLKIVALFFADDGLVFAETIADARNNIRILREVSKECGLDINVAKSSILIYNLRDGPEEIEGIYVKKELKYLGVELINERNIYKNQIRKSIEKAQKLANVTYSVIGKSCNKLLIGKTFWKSIVLPTILYAINIMNIREIDIEKLQVIENGVYRKILGAPKYAANSTLRGEIGASKMKSRVIESRLQYIRSIGERENELLKRVLEDQLDKTGLWTRKTKEWMEYIGVSSREVKSIKKDELKKKIKEKDTRSWKEEIESKSSLVVYRQWKKEIKEEQIYDNRRSSEILFRARSNSLKLEDRKRHMGENGECKICNQGIENLQHFILECKELNEERKKAVWLQRPYRENENEIIGEFLFGVENLCEKKEILNDMWKRREKKIKELN